MGRHPPGMTPAGGRLHLFRPRLLFVVHQPGHIEKTRHHRLRVIALTLEQQFINEALASSAAMRQQILELFQTMQMHLQLRIAPAACTRAHRGG